MPKILNRRGIIALLWPDGDITVPGTLDAAMEVCNQIMMSQAYNAAILESFGNA